MIRLILCTIVISFSFIGSKAQQFDILLKGGHVIDAKNNIDEVMDVAVSGNTIARVDKNISSSDAAKTVDVKGLYVVPGLIDIHAHNFFGTKEDAYLSNSYIALPPDGFTFRSGVTTVVDAGGAGLRNFKTFKKQAIDHSKTRVLCFLNIVGSGMKGGAVEQNLADMDAKLTAIEARAHAEYIVGVKVAHYQGDEWEPVERAVVAGKLADIPVMIDFGGSQPALSLETLFMEKLRPGDIFTHAYAHVNGRMPIVDSKGKLRPFVLEAQKKGIIFDVGHGGGSFLFGQAVPAVEQGLKPNTISTDLHTGSMNGGMKDITNIMSKFLNMGMTIREVVECTTIKAAIAIKKPALGHLSTGAVADLAVLKLENGAFGFIDTKGLRMDGNKKLVCELTIRNGAVVWDLNGIASPSWR